jgi:hypothetical protein
MRLKIKTFSSLIAAIFLATFSIAVSAGQEVYYADRPLPQIAAELRERFNIEDDAKISEILKVALPKVTPEFAKMMWNIEWKDNSNGDYPIVAVCYIDSKVGYGLFALSNIQPENVIVEYTGEYSNDPAYPSNPYIANFSAGGLVDAKLNVKCQLSLPFGDNYLCRLVDKIFSS